LVKGGKEKMINAEKFKEVFGVEPDKDCCPLDCMEYNGGLACIKCEKRNWFKEEFKEQNELFK
jgi:hypothetical protein